jgi:glutathione synthase/RimK-type ligase-like ATP-grasp enzyme
MVLDLLRFPEQLRLSLGDRTGAVFVDGEPLRPAAVYVRDLGLFPLRRRLRGQTADDLADQDMRRDWRRTLIAVRERDDMVHAVALRWEQDGVPLYNGAMARLRCTKPFQLALLHGAGLPVPDTLWSNDPAAVRAFSGGRAIAYKPVTGGALTQELVPADLEDARLALLAAAPVTFQALLPGEDVRVYVLDDEVIAALRIEARTLDFRGGEPRVVPIELPDVTREQCRQAARLLGLRFTGIDLKRDAGGVLRFLECNTSPMFVGLDAQAGTCIAGRLAQRLASWV